MTTADAPPTGFPVDVRSTGRGRTMSAGEITLLNSVSLLGVASGCLEDVWTDDTPTVLDGHLVLAVALSLAAADPMYQDIERRGFHMIAALSHRAQLSGPVRAGDTLRAESEVVSSRASTSRPGQFVVDIRDRCTNQHSEPVAEIERTVLYRWDAPDDGGRS